MHEETKKLLQDWQEEVASSLVQGFRQLFESSSQVLLEFADAAENNRLQRLFFDAQREFYLKEETIIEAFDNALRDGLADFGWGAKHPAQLGAETLSLVEVDDYERSLALETIAKRTVDRQQEALHALSQRLSALLGGRPIPVDDVPANPLQVIRYFDPASRKLEVEKEVRLVFYTLFDRYVMSRLGDLYLSLNEKLVALGILPNIKFDYQRHGGGAGHAGAPDAGGADPGAATDAFSDAGAVGGGPVQGIHPPTPSSAETLSAISSLLMAKRQAELRTAPVLQTSVPIVPTAANVGEAIADARVLAEAPHPLPMHAGGGQAKVAIDAALLMRVKGALQKQRQIIKSLVGKDQLDRREEDVIDIVGMLFEAMLNEKLLPNSVKTLLSHLHTRYLKIAVQSPDFLDNTQHPARRLFERMLDAGIRWVREENLRAGIYPQLQEIVTRILKEENPPEGFFDDQIAYLAEAEEKLEQQSTATEERTLEAERGRARLDEAKSIVKKTVFDLGSGGAMAAQVRRFLETTYADYLTLLLLRCDLDTESDVWSEAYGVGEALVATAVHAAAGNPISETMRKDLNDRLHASVGSLIPHHEQNIRQAIEALEAPAAEPAAPAPAAEPPVPEARVAPDAAPAPKAAATAKAEGAPITDEDRKVADKLMREAGNWFVMQQGTGEEEQAVKLLWVNPHTRNMLFVDQHGAKVALMPAGNVARMMREGAVRPMQQETSSFVARSLRRIRRALEDSVNA
ncbi:MAG: DUF1631 family protein [Chromatiaceae bacterium]|jgi:hypothetical protein